ncbi:hypothetical protein ACJX0J_030170, partial [Zea mays]
PGIAVPRRRPEVRLCFCMQALLIWLQNRIFLLHSFRCCRFTFHIESARRNMNYLIIQMVIIGDNYTCFLDSVKLDLIMPNEFQLPNGLMISEKILNLRAILFFFCANAKAFPIALYTSMLPQKSCLDITSTL